MSTKRFPSEKRSPSQRRVLVPLAHGFEEIEAITIIDVLRRADLDVVTAGLSHSPARGAHGIEVMPDTCIDEVRGEDFDMIVLPGGMPGAENLRNDPHVQEILGCMKKNGRWTAAICAAPIALEPSGISAGRSVTSYPGFEDQIGGATYLENRVVVDGPVITSRGPGTALEFALTLVERLQGEGNAHELEKGMLVVRSEQPHVA